MDLSMRSSHPGEATARPRACTGNRAGQEGGARNEPKNASSIPHPHARILTFQRAARASPAPGWLPIDDASFQLFTRAVPMDRICLARAPGCLPPTCPAPPRGRHGSAAVAATCMALVVWHVLGAVRCGWTDG